MLYNRRVLLTPKTSPDIVKNLLIFEVKLDPCAICDVYTYMYKPKPEDILYLLIDINS